MQDLTLSSPALESEIPELLFNTDPTNPINAISAIKALQIASIDNQRIYHITPSNQAVTLPNIHQNDKTMQEIRDALAAGKEVIAHTNPVSVPGWSGAGYIILDPLTGDGAYKIGGGANGGEITLSWWINTLWFWAGVTWDNFVNFIMEHDFVIHPAIDAIRASVIALDALQHCSTPSAIFVGILSYTFLLISLGMVFIGELFAEVGGFVATIIAVAFLSVWNKWLEAYLAKNC